MKKQKLVEWVAGYLTINGQITREAVERLYGPIGDSTLSARISTLRQQGWVIKRERDAFVLVSRPLPVLDDLPSFAIPSGMILVPRLELEAHRDWLNRLINN